MKDFDPPTFEEVDLEILRILSKDGRDSYRKIAIELNRSPVTIKKHVEKLEEKGIIKGYGIQIDFEKLGYNIYALIEITISKGKMLDVEKEIAQNPNVFGVYDITGNYDALIFARFKTRPELSAMIKNLHASPNVERTNTHLILNIIKEGSSFAKLLDMERKINK